MSNSLDRRFVQAALDGDVKTMRKLLGKGAYINAVVNGRTALCHALHSGFESMFQFLMKQPGIDVNQADSRSKPLVYACRSFECFRQLVEAGADARNLLCKIIHMRPSADVVQYLISHCGVEAIEIDYTVLYRFVERRCNDVVAVIANSGLEIGEQLAYASITFSH